MSGLRSPMDSAGAPKPDLVGSAIDRSGDLPKNTRPMSNPLSHKRLAVLGAGKMGGILLRAFLDQKLVSPGPVTATVRHAERAEKLGKELGVRIGTDNHAAVHGADVVLLAVKPMQMAEVLQEIRPELKPGAVLVSIAASVPTKFIEQHLGGEIAVVRAMPNTPRSEEHTSELQSQFHLVCRLL